MRNLSRFVAALLVTLITAPFTAPFSSCDFESMFGDSAAQHSSLLGDRNTHHAPMVPARSAAAISSDVAIPSVPVVSTDGRRGLSPVFEACASVDAPSLSTSTTRRSAPSARGSGRSSTQTTVLRL